jgi:hypothetical protein
MHIVAQVSLTHNPDTQHIFSLVGVDPDWSVPAGSVPGSVHTRQRNSQTAARQGTLQKRLSFFQSLTGMSLTELSLAGNNLIIPGQGDFG